MASSSAWRWLAIPAIMVTQDLNEALLLGDRMTLLAHGRTLQSDPPREVIGRPVNEVAARLVGIRNLFDGEILHQDQNAGVTWLRVVEKLRLQPNSNTDAVLREDRLHILPPESCRD